MQFSPHNALRRWQARREAAGRTAPQVAELAATDIGFRVARDIFRLAADEGHPALILVNGNTAVEALGTAEAGRVRWEETPYPSVSNPAKRLRHWEGTYRAARGRCPSRASRSCGRWAGSTRTRKWRS